MSQYVCWRCGLLQGEEWEPWEPSKLCPSCSEALNRANRRYKSGDHSDREEEN